MTKFLVLGAAALSLSACSGIVGKITEFTGLSADQLMCIGQQIAGVSGDADKRAAAAAIAAACSVDVDSIVFGTEQTTVVADGQTVLVAE